MTFRALAGGGSACSYCGFCLVMEGPRQCCPGGRDYDALASRLAEAERDAARYRWLRERINWRDVDESGGAFNRDPLKYHARHWTHSDVRLPSARPASEHIDEYIDAQLTADSASGGE